jgi:thiol-disulfide isomerase/thioredoxin
MRIIFFCVVCLIWFNVNAQFNRIAFDDARNQNILYGQCEADAFYKDGFKQWFITEYDNYEIDSLLHKFNLYDEIDEVIVFFATWCGDTRRELPRFVKITEQEVFNDINVIYFGLDSNKQTDDVDTDEYRIIYVPTFIFYKDGSEIGRIIEAPSMGLEKDIISFTIPK